VLGLGGVTSGGLSLRLFTLMVAVVVACAFVFASVIVMVSS